MAKARSVSLALAHGLLGLRFPSVCNTLCRYDVAEHCAQRALVLDPTFMKARYRRGLARKASLQLYAATLGALTRATSRFATTAETKGWHTRTDFEAILEQDPDSAEATKALDETITLMDERDESEGSVVVDEAFPSLDEPNLELESVSDSSEWNHEGNGIPCRFYNHEGCMRGIECRFSHAPDHKSVRDRLCAFPFPTIRCEEEH